MIFNHELSNAEVDFLFQNPGVNPEADGRPVAIVPSGGLFTNSVFVSIINNLGAAELRYTLDGTAPTATSPRYAQPLLLTNRTLVTVQAFLAGFPIQGAATNALFERVYALDDGLPNAWRERYFGTNYLTDPRVGAQEDPDADGSTNYEEFIAGTDPLDPLSGFRLGIRSVPELRWEGVADVLYRVLRRESVTATNWTVIAEVRGTNGVATYVDQGRPVPAGFYLLQPVPQP